MKILTYLIDCDKTSILILSFCHDVNQSLFDDQHHLWIWYVFSKRVILSNDDTFEVHIKQRSVTLKAAWKNDAIVIATQWSSHLQIELLIAALKWCIEAV